MAWQEASEETAHLKKHLEKTRVRAVSAAGQAPAKIPNAAGKQVRQRQSTAVAAGVGQGQAKKRGMFGCCGAKPEEAKSAGTLPNVASAARGQSPGGLGREKTTAPKRVPLKPAEY